MGPANGPFLAVPDLLGFFGLVGLVDGTETEGQSRGAAEEGGSHSSAASSARTAPATCSSSDAAKVASGDVPAPPKRIDGICFYIYFNIFFAGKGRGTMNQVGCMRAHAWWVAHVLPAGGQASPGERVRLPTGDQMTGVRSARGGKLQKAQTEKTVNCKKR